MAAVKEKRVEDSMIEQVHKLRPTHMNGMGRLFGGQLMSWIDEVACLVGNRHSQYTGLGDGASFGSDLRRGAW